MCISPLLLPTLLLVIKTYELTCYNKLNQMLSLSRLQNILNAMVICLTKQQFCILNINQNWSMED